VGEYQSYLFLPTHERNMLVALWTRSSDGPWASLYDSDTDGVRFAPALAHVHTGGGIAAGRARAVLGPFALQTPAALLHNTRGTAAAASATSIDYERVGALPGVILANHVLNWETATVGDAIVRTVFSTNDGPWMVQGGCPFNWHSADEGRARRPGGAWHEIPAPAGTFCIAPPVRLRIHSHTHIVAHVYVSTSVLMAWWGGHSAHCTCTA
jgi:hypothetical protein